MRLEDPWWLEKRPYVIWLVVWNMFYFSISYMGCHPSHWRTPSFFRGVSQPPTRYIYIPSLTIINHYFFWLIMFIFFRGIGQPSHSHIPHRVTMVFLINRQGCWAIRSLMEVLCTESRRTRTWWFFLDSPWLRKPRYQWIGLRENLQETMVLNMFKSINQWEYLKYF